MSGKLEKVSIMIRKLVCGATALAICATQVTPAAAQSYRFRGFDGPQGASATVNLRVPLGPRAGRSRPSLGLSLNYGRPEGETDHLGRRRVRQIGLADFRLDRSDPARWRVLGVTGGGEPDPSETAPQNEPGETAPQNDPAETAPEAEEAANEATEEIYEGGPGSFERQQEGERRSAQNRKKSIWFAIVGTLVAMSAVYAMTRGGGSQDEDPETTDPFPGD